jgi:hypothetical protein
MFGGSTQQEIKALKKEDVIKHIKAVLESAQNVKNENGSESIIS